MKGWNYILRREGMKKIFHQQIDRFRHGPDAKIVIMGGLMTPNILNYGYIYRISLIRFVIQDVIFTQNMQFMSLKSPKSVTRVLIWGLSLEFIINKGLKVHRLQMNLGWSKWSKAITPVFTCRYEIKLPKIQLRIPKIFEWLRAPSSKM